MLQKACQQLVKQCAAGAPEKWTEPFRSTLDPPRQVGYWERWEGVDREGQNRAGREEGGKEAAGGMDLATLAHAISYPLWSSLFALLLLGYVALILLVQD